MREVRGTFDARGRRFAVAAFQFNDLVTSKLVEGAVACLRAHGIAEEDLVVVWVPGAFELPLTARRLATSGLYDAVVCLGAVIRGETAHFEHEHRMRHEDGTYRWMLCRGAAVRADGRSVRLAGSLTDVTERTTVTRSMMPAMFGKCSQISWPGTRVRIAFISPWISAGASGFGSKVSCCGGEP